MESEQNTNKKFILLVEDDVYLQKAFKLKFEDNNVNLRVVGDGKEAVNMINQNNPELPSVVVLDLILPHIGGIEILKIMHERSGWKDVPVVILTNVSQVIDLEYLRKLGARDYLIKTDITIDKAVDKILSYYNG